MSSTIARLRHASPGFSLVEMLTTVSLLGIISAIAATNFKGYFPIYRSRGAAMEVAGDMNQARLAAVKEARQYFFVPQGGTSYQIRYQNGAVQTVLKTVDVASDYPQVRFGATGITVDPYGGAIGAAVPAAAVVFNSDGTITSAANVFVEPTVTAPTAQHAITVTAAGRIRVWHYNGSAWN